MSKPARTAFIGREPELERLRAALDTARAGRPTTVLLGGEAGVGKSRLVDEFLSGVEDAFVAVGGSPPGGESELPFVVVTELLRSVSRQLTEAEADEVLGPARPFLAPLLPSGADSEPAGASRMTLFEAVLLSVERLAALRGSIILVLEDLHWADRSTRELLGYLVWGLREGRVMIVATYRLEDTPIGHPLRVLLAELDRSERVTRFELARFNRDEVAAQLAALRGSAPDNELLAAIAARSDGNAYFVEELAANARTGQPMPETLREMLRSRITGLPAPVDQLLRLCAAFGPEVDSRLVAAMAPLSPHDLGLVLRDAIARDLLVSRRDGALESYAFRHALLHEVVYEDMLAVERQRYHRAIATILDANPEYIAGPPSIVEGITALHWYRAGAPARARVALVRAGIAAEDAYAFPEAAAAYEAAIGLWAQADADEEAVVATTQRPIGFRAEPIAAGGQPGLDRTAIVRRAATVISLAGRPGEAAALLQSILDDHGEPSDWLRLGRYLDEDGETDAALRAYDRGADLTGDDVRLAARIASARASTLAAAGRYRDARDAARSALELADAAGSESLARSARETLGIALAMDGELDAGLAELTQARRSTASSRRASMVHPRPSQIGEVIRGLAGHAAVLDRAGRPTEFGEAARAGADVARQLGVGATLGSTISILEARNRFLAGEWDLVDRETAAMLAGPLGRSDEARLRLLRAWLDMLRGADDEAATQLENVERLLDARGESALLGELAARDAELAIGRAQLTEARAAVDRGIARIHETDDQVAIIGLAWLGIRAEADRAEGSRVRRAQADLAESTRVATALHAEVVALRARLAKRTSSAPRDLRVMAAFADAEWSRLAYPSDAALWAEATAGAAALREPWLVAYGSWRQADALLAGRGSRGEAEALVRSAHEHAVRIGAAPLATEIVALARRARVDLEIADAAPTAESAPAARDTLGLTEREVEVLTLVAEGYTNRRIAETLFITEKTAGHHVSNVLGKLGASTRVEAAAMAHRLGLLDGVVVGDRA